MLKNKKLMNVVSRFLTVLLLFTLGSPSFAVENNPSTNIHTFTSPKLNYPDKISSKLTDEFNSEKYVTYIIKLSEQPDVMSISNNSLHKFKAKNVTARTAVLNTRSVVVNSLREASTRTQASLMDYLDDKKASGDVKDYKSFYIVNSMAITSTKKVMEEIAKRNDVAKVLPNETVQLNDNQSTETSSSNNETKKEVSQGDRNSPKSDEPVDPNIQWDINLIGVPKVWKQGIDGKGIVVGSLDTGVDYTHPALFRKWRAVDENGKVSNPELSWFDPTPRHTILPFDGIGHGTHTMGIMVGSEENGTHKIGVAPGAKWMSARIFDSSGHTTTEILLEAGQWMLAPTDAEGNLHPELAPDVINNSWGGGPGLDEFYRLIVQAWKAANIVPVFSAGNTNSPYKAEPGTVANPANYPESFAVGATDKFNNLADFSLRGPSPYGQIKPDVSAPGVKVLSSFLNGSYVEEDGTSMAGPIVAGVAALMLQENASLDVDKLEYIIKQTATPMTNSDYNISPNNGYGYGIVNAYNAVQTVTSGVGTLTGKVTTPGEDNEKPVIEYTPIKLAYTNDDNLHLDISVSDNINVGTVEAFARITGDQDWTSIQMDQISGDNRHGVFEGLVPSVLETTAGVEYYFKVSDFGNNQVTTDINSITITDGVTPGYFQNFEENFDGYKIYGKNNTWQWGEPTRGPDSAFSGKKVVGTNLSGAYYPNSTADLQLPTINLLDSPGGAILSFKQWYDLEQDKDFGTVYISANSTGNVYMPIETITSFNGKWDTRYIDLRNYGGQQVKVKLELTSDDEVQNLGWYIDDVSLETDHTPPGAPSNLSGYADPLNFINLKWDAPQDNDVQFYNVYRSTTPGSGYESSGGSVTPDFIDTWVDGKGPFYYVVTAVDYSGNESVYSNEISVSLESNPKVIFQDNFDGPDDNGWTHSGTIDEWERGKPQGGPSEASSVPNVWGTDLDGNYEDNSDYSLYSPIIDLSNTIHPIVAFQDWFQIQGYTYGKPLDDVSFEISSDGGTSWTKIQDYNGLYGNSWFQDGFNLEAYKGKQVQFRFHLTSNESLNYAGFYLDDFQVLDVNDNVAASILSHNRPDIHSVKSTTNIKNESNKSSNTVISTPKEETSGVIANGLPIIGSTVTLLETGQSVITDPRNGTFKINALPGTYTARAEAYGYYPEDQTITITDNETTTADFSLETIPHGMIQGVITDQTTGQPISHARIMVMEDARVSPVYTDSNGMYTLDCLAGDYTLSVSAPDFYDQQLKVTVAGGQTTSTSVGLKSFTGLSGELGYDDGSMESTTAFNKAGTLQAVLMTPDTNTVEVTGAKIMFFDERFPAPGGTDFKYALYDASGPKGAPGKMIACQLKGLLYEMGIGPPFTLIQEL
ncbi:S8 family serine peptidase [Neobacillus sp. PS3-34]|uniref:S8 family serine peptidase n=1 Tax=Neobacillus sp. PS3-34 TaxID=3070678 RepID=UPI0027DF929D|nr:S8 family serine peptidase [Neobacillus sp. PS3-34]WML49091.1 S8 family serine peptidase [Neobacillus sp. PS3-34]